jgi:hypothetical protein
MKILLTLISILLFINVHCAYGPRFWPYPNNVTTGLSTYTIDPCQINYKISTIPVYLVENKDFYLIEVFKCTKSPVNLLNAYPSLNVTLNVIVTNMSLLPPMLGYEAYNLTAL